MCKINIITFYKDIGIETTRCRNILARVIIATPAEWNALTDAIHANYPHFIDRLREKYKKISRTELQVSYLSAIGLRQKQMSSLMNTTPQNIHNIRNRLYSRLTGERCNTVRQFDELIENIKSDN